jgi:Flp pilus assembly protein TadG
LYRGEILMVMSSILRNVRRLRGDERGAVAVIMGVLLVPLVGFLALGFEVSNWYVITRGMQNAADAATIAAAINNGANYDVEAKAVAAQYGFINGVNNVSISVTNTAACPAGGNTCYSVSISGYTPLLLSEVLGFQGDKSINGTFQKQLNAVAVATPTQPQPICLVALAKSGTSIQTNGAPTSNFNGCNSLSNSGAQCNGHNLGIGISFAVGSNSGCGAKQASTTALGDPYASLATTNLSGINPSTVCPGGTPPGTPAFPQESAGANGYPSPTNTAPANNIDLSSGTINLAAGNNFWCGDMQLTKDVTVNTPAGQSSVLIIENGQLDVNGFAFRTSAGSALTLVFSGTNGSYTHAPTNTAHGSSGALDITAPTTGPWSGVAIYQDPSLTTGVDVSAAGNSPTWNITGLIYMPHASVTLKGAIDKGTNGKSCVVLVADNFQISGTGGILKTDTGQCKAAGLAQPTAKITATALVL